MSGPARKVCYYLLGVLGLVLSIRLINHAWPPASLLGVVIGGSYYLWYNERRRDERLRLGRLQEAERRGEHGRRD